MPDQMMPLVYTLAQLVRPRPGSRLIFAFDQMMDEAVIRKHCREARFVSTGRYLSHQFIWNADGVAGVTRHRGSTVYGVIWEVEEDVIAALDLHHGVPDRFDRYGALIRGANDELATAEYFAPRNHRHGKSNVGELLGIIDLASRHNFPAAYVEGLMDLFPPPAD